MTTTITHKIISVEAVAKTEPGALDGFEATCSCGHKMRTSLSANAARELGWGHANYMNAKAA